MSDHRTNCAYQYTVKKGDSFYLIAHRTGVSLRDLLDANPGIPPSRLMIGDVLCIPGAAAAQTPAGESAACDDETSHGCGNQNGASVPVPPCAPNRRTVVQNDQTAADLQVRYGLSYRTLQNANPNVDLEGIRGGDVLCIPEGNVACDAPLTVALGAGDTLNSAAAAYQTTPAALLRANPCLAPGDFKQGAVIRLPQ